MAPKKLPKPKRKFIFQPSFFRGKLLNFQGVWYIFLVIHAGTPFLIGCSIMFTIHFGVPLFLETPTCWHKTVSTRIIQYQASSNSVSSKSSSASWRREQVMVGTPRRPSQMGWKKSFEQDGLYQQELGDIQFKFKLSLPVYPLPQRKITHRSCKNVRSPCRLPGQTASIAGRRCLSPLTACFPGAGKARTPVMGNLEQGRFFFKSPSSLHWFTQTSWVHPPMTCS